MLKKIALNYGRLKVKMGYIILLSSVFERHGAVKMFLRHRRRFY